MKLFQHLWLLFVALMGSLALRRSSMVVRQTMYSVDAVRTDLCVPLMRDFLFFTFFAAFAQQVKQLPHLPLLPYSASAH